MKNLSRGVQLQSNSTLSKHEEKNLLNILSLVAGALTLLKIESSLKIKIRRSK
jgi:hypothetical protein